MAIIQTKKQSDLEKRLLLLRRQVYGKSPENQYVGKSVDQQINKSATLTHRYTDTPIHQTTDALTPSDLTYLRQDLLKIFLLSSFAIGAQVILFYAVKQFHGLFFLLKNNILRINIL